MSRQLLHRLSVLSALVAALAIPFSLSAQQEPTSTAEASNDASIEAAGETADDEQASTFLDEITVSSTRSERTVGETAGSTTVIDAEKIADELMIDSQDLVRYEPGVYVDSDPTRLGLSGFNIRGIGGNRVQTQVDGIPTAEQFDFGPFSATQVGIELVNLQSAEIVRSSGSSLYGSDALGGVVSLVTKSPRDILGADSSALGVFLGYSGRNEEEFVGVSVAGQTDQWLGSLFVSGRQAAETENQGTLASNDRTRTAPNPIDTDDLNGLAKLTRVISPSNEIEFAAEFRNSESETDVISSQRVIDFSFVLPPGGQFLIDVQNVDAVDEQERTRFSLRQLAVVPTAIFDDFSWQGYVTQTETTQVVDELRINTVTLFGPPSVQRVARSGSFEFEQEGFGAEAQFRKTLGQSVEHRLTYGLSLRRDTFDVLRDREDIDLDTGALVPSSLIFPTKYFPESDVDEYGLYLQDEIELANGRLLLVPGVRYDRYDLQPDGNDQIFLDGNPGQPDPVGLEDSAVSPRLGVVASLTSKVSLVAQYASGFRAPPFSAVNNGFTNQAGGYRTLPNPDLEAETSRNVEAGFRFASNRGAFSVTYFDNTFDEFIETVTLGFNPQVGLLEFQPQNIDQVEISGVELSTDHRIASAWRLRTAFAYIEGDNVTDNVPLESIAPPEAVIGLDFNPANSPWNASLVATVVDDKDAEDLPGGRFAPEGYETLDLYLGYRFSESWDVRLGGFNLTDETYWQWSNARGLSASSSVLDRYTSPGRQAALSLRFRR
ncbi:MAG: TonB-dependent hemoglobin/transferrin/lactoferrin family receptor [Acidobacteriota bacterium]